jgi:hypothetical protein
LLLRSTTEVKWQIGIWEDPSAIDSTSTEVDTIEMQFSIRGDPSATDSTGTEVHTYEITSFSDTEQIISKLFLSEDENSFYFVTHDTSN